MMKNSSSSYVVMVCIEVSNIFVIVIMKLVKKFVMTLVTSLGQAFVHGIFLMHHRLPQGNKVALE
jgi:hypothetical protein